MQMHGNFLSRAKGRWTFIVCPQSARIATSASRPVDNINWPCYKFWLLLQCGTLTQPVHTCCQVIALLS